MGLAGGGAPQAPHQMVLGRRRRMYWQWRGQLHQGACDDRAYGMAAAPDGRHHHQLGWRRPGDGLHVTPAHCAWLHAARGVRVMRGLPAVGGAHDGALPCRPQAA